MTSYVLLTWPDSQYLMLEDWFDECIPVPAEYLNEYIPSGSYFAPEFRYDYSNLTLDSSGLIFYIE